MKKLDRNIEFIRKELIASKKMRMDPWTTSKRSIEEQQNFKQALVNYYQRDAGNNQLYCMVLNRAYDRQHVIASHIWKYCTRGKGLNEFGLKATDINNPRNGLLVAEGIEKAFDIKQLCFLWDPLQTCFKLVVLDPSLLNQLVVPSTTQKFQDIQSSVLHHPQQNFPYRRILGWHAKMSYEFALEQGWIDSNTFSQFQDYSYLSNPGSLPDSDWKEDDSEQS